MTTLQTAASTGWLMFGWLTTTVGVACFVLALAGTPTAQQTIPKLGKLRGVPNHDFHVLPGAEARNVYRAQEMPELEPVTFAQIKPLIEGYIEEGRALYVALAASQTADEIGAIYDKAGEWQERVAASLSNYQKALSEDFYNGGSYMTPQHRNMHPTSREDLEIFIQRRGQILRNVLDATPGRDLPHWTKYRPEYN